jgi:hypothetical protein
MSYSYLYVTENDAIHSTLAVLLSRFTALRVSAGPGG